MSENINFFVQNAISSYIYFTCISLSILIVEYLVYFLITGILLHFKDKKYILYTSYIYYKMLPEIYIFNIKQQVKHKISIHFFGFI